MKWFKKLANKFQISGILANVEWKLKAFSHETSRVKQKTEDRLQNRAGAPEGSTADPGLPGRGPGPLALTPSSSLCVPAEHQLAKGKWRPLGKTVITVSQGKK